MDELVGACDKHSSAYHQFFRCGKVPPSLADDIHRLELEERESHCTDIDEKVKITFLSTILPYLYLEMKKETLILSWPLNMLKINNNKYCPQLLLMLFKYLLFSIKEINMKKMIR